jgi:hypothetical protein
MTESTSAESAPAASPHGGLGSRVRSTIVATWALFVGALPHVLHHVGPLAGAAIVSSAGGRALFGVAGFLLTIPMLRRMRRRTNSWRAPMIALAIFVVMYLVSSLIVGPALTGSSSPDTQQPRARSGDEHANHHNA